MLSKIAIFNPDEGTFSIKTETVNENLEPNQVLLKNLSIAVNEIDVVDGKVRKLKNLGCSACGEVIKVGENVTWVNRGDRVAYFTETGAYSEYKAVDHTKLVKIPSNISSNTAVAVLYRGCLAHMIAVRAFIIRGGINALIDNIHTATSSAIGWMAKKRGAFVVGVTSEELEISPNVCDVVIKSTGDAVVKEILSATKNVGCHVYYPGLSPMPIDKVGEALTVSGVIVDYLNVMQSVPTEIIAAKSLFFTIPSLIDYKNIRSELILTVDEVFAMLSQTPLDIEFAEYSFEKINDAFAVTASNKSRQAVVVKF